MELTIAFELTCAALGFHAARGFIHSFICIFWRAYCRRPSASQGKSGEKDIIVFCPHGAYPLTFSGGEAGSQQNPGL